MTRRKSEFAKWMGPTLDTLRSLGGSGKAREVVDLVAEQHAIADEKLEATLKSGQTRFHNSFKVLFQCKRYQGTVSRAQVGDFRNAMIGRADKGIIITTGSFSMDARREADREGAPPVELVDGEKLVEMFERVELGLTPKTVYEVDHAYFAPFLGGPA